MTAKVRIELTLPAHLVLEESFSSVARGLYFRGDGTIRDTDTPVVRHPGGGESTPGTRSIVGRWELLP
ncbi:hypothetical protein GMYAFLOJ_CDS0051 [Microbacterium phage phiMiGM15]